MPDRQSEFRGPHTAYEGIYRVRLNRKGPWVAAEIRFEDGRAVAYIQNERQPAIMDSWGLMPVDRIAIWGEEIPATEHSYLLALAAHAKAHRPWHPSANPERAIDLRLLPPVYTPKNRSA